MTVQQMIEKLQTLPPDMKVFWTDHVEGNDCEAVGLVVGPGGYKPPSVRGIRNEKVGFRDTAEDAADRDMPAVKKLMDLVAQGEVVLVHCHHGASRSPHVVASALARINLQNYDQAYNEVRERHPRTMVYSIEQEIRDKGLRPD